jgi:hypothetical protein
MIEHSVATEPSMMVGCDFCRRPVTKKDLTAHLFKRHKKMKLPNKIVDVSDTKSTMNYLAYIKYMQRKTKRGGGDRVLRFPCNICKQSFYNQRDLKAHVTIHENSQSLLECPICRRKITNKSGSKLHLIYKHLKLMQYDKYFCLICAQRYWGKECLVEHVNKHHKDDILFLEQSTGVCTDKNPLEAIESAAKIILKKYL